MSQETARENRIVLAMWTLEAVIEAPDVKHIYECPVVFKKRRLDEADS